MDRLPPLNAIRAFEVVARRLSITVAAEELHVTPGAVSRQVRTLEDALGVALLVRGHRQITLTRAGEDYYRSVTRAMDVLRDATTRLTRRTRRTQLKVRAYTTFAMRWLIPRLSSFHTANRGIEVLLTASLDPVDFRREDIDGAIRLGDGKWQGVNAYRLVRNVLTPVCSPALATGVRKAGDLQRQVLLHSIARPDDWASWLAAAKGDAVVDARSGMTYQSSAMAYAAALEGQGFAIAQRFLVEDDLASGKLVAPFRKALDMGDFTYYLITPADRKESPSMATFRKWLLAQFGDGAPG
ncbi:transcriptional regulator GcvA [Cupriavidus agavae]|uniref:LysR family glycine cleavage system transcriptional activator n=1 Tax=Cupriavidus agavae TaxID=1001822 RepID=A0A4Q7RF30_9BURK|nr:transcriptional regulator GcvA [Cupriavidus agavae]RZT31816.1 LysR family glycine cleavage system transcriptional activator [Cupriavidus agavae]